MRKFNFLVIDDKHKNDEGWYRIFEYVLIADDYLVPGQVKGELLDAKQTVLQKQKSSKTTAMNYMVLSSETGFNFNSSCNYLVKHEPEFDFFFIDIDLRFGGFLKNAIMDNDYLGHPELAGFQFIQLLPLTKRPIFYFSGARAEKINETLMNLKIWGSRLSDVCFGKIEMSPIPEDLLEFAFDEPTNFINQIYDRIDKYMYGIQFNVCSRLDIATSNKLCSIILSNNMRQFDEPIIPCPEKIGEYWTLRTLFPKQVNKIELNKITAEKHRGYILDMLQTDWRKLMCSFAEPKQSKSTSFHGLLRHPGNITHIDKFLDAVEYSELTETKKVPHWDYIQVTKLKEYQDFKESALNSHGQHNNFSKIAKKINNIIGDSSYCDSKWKEVKIADAKNIWAENYGILPTDILHVHKIVLHNADTYENDLSEFKYRQTPDRKTITFEWLFSKSFFVSLQAERRVFSLIDNDVKVLSTAGVPDICKLACARYKGQFELYGAAPQNKITIKYTQGKFEFTGEEEIKDAQGYRIIIQSPLYDQS
jgi:hypothetical protein